MDIASLGFKIDTSDVAKAERDLDALTASGAKTEAAAKGTGAAWADAGRKVGAAAGAAKKGAPAFDEGAKAVRRQQEELGRLLGKIDPVVAALDRLDRQEQQLRGFKAGGLLDAESFSQYKGKIDAARESLGAIDGDLRRSGISAKQSAMALRQLPAQFSDIAISLQAGQSPLSVFLQQGAQIRDSFGGAVPALRETARYALGLVNPFTAAAAAAVVLALAYKQGSDEATAYNKAIILTGNQTGVTAGRLEAMASTIDGVTGTQRQAAQALAEIVSTGKFAADQIEAVGAAAVAMEEATGKAISDTVSEFARLADEPAAASAKLNEQYAYLTASVYEQISALEQQGDAAGAAELAINTFAEAMKQRSDEIDGKLGLIEGSWRRIKSAAAEAWDEMLNVGREQTLEDQLAALDRRGVDAGGLASNGLVLGPIGLVKELYDQVAPQVKASTDEGARQVEQQRTRLQLQIQQRDQEAEWQAEVARTNQESISAQQQIARVREDGLSRAEKKEKALADYRASLDKVRAADPYSKLLNPEQIEKDLADIEAKFAEKVRKTTAKAYTDDAATKMLQGLREQEAALNAQLQGSEKLTAAQRAQVQWAQQLADLKGKAILTAEQQSLLANEQMITAQLDKNAAISDEIKLREESAKLAERQAQLQGSMQGSQANRREQYDRQLGAFGQGQQAQQRAEGESSIFREFRRYQDDLNKATPKGMLGSEQYKQARDEIGQGLRSALAEHEAYYQRLEALQGSWQVGASQAFADYADQAGDIAGQTANLVGGVMDGVTTGIADNLAQAMVYGENLQESMRGLADTILTEVLGALIEMGVRYGVNSALEIAGITAVTGAKVAATTTETTAELAGITATTGAEVTKATTVSGAQIGAIAATKAASTAATTATAAEQVAAAGTTTSAWSLAAIVASIGSFGTAAAVGLAAVVAAMAFGKGFRTGGYTGSGGVNDPAGIVHGQEFVFTAESVKRLGRGNLEALQAGRDIASSSVPSGSTGVSGGTSPGSPTYITVHQPNVTSAREAKASSMETRRQLGRLVAGTQRAM